MGLNNQNQHNVLFRGFLKAWETYTGAKINWIDLAQADYNARLQQSIATGTVDFDIIEMGAPFEGDICGQGPAVRDARLGRDPDRDGRLCGLPARRRSAPGTARPIASRSTATATPSATAPTIFADAGDRRGLEGGGQRQRLGVPVTWQQVQAVDQGPEGPERPADRRPGLRLSRPAEGLGRLRLLLPRKPRDRLCQASRTTRPGSSTPTR